MQKAEPRRNGTSRKHGDERDGGSEVTANVGIARVKAADQRRQHRAGSRDGDGGCRPRGRAPHEKVKSCRSEQGKDELQLFEEDERQIPRRGVAVHQGGFFREGARGDQPPQAAQAAGIAPKNVIDASVSRGEQRLRPQRQIRVNE